MKRYEVRKEFFGSIVYDFLTRKFIAFDEKSTNSLVSLTQENIKDLPLNVLNALKKNDFIKNGELNYSIADNKPLNKVLSAPLRLHLAYTARCNLNCAHCFARDYNNKKGVNPLTFKQKVDILDQMLDLGIHEILIGGGEPFIEPDFIDYLRECEKRNMNTKVFTNGHLITDEIIEELSKIKLGYISVSVDGACDESYGKIRGISKLKSVVNTIKKLTEKCQFPVVMQTTATKTNFGEIEALLQLAKDTHVKRLKVRPIKPGGSVLENQNIVLKPEEFLEFIKKMETAWQEKYKNDFELDYSWGNARLYFDCSENTIEMEGLPQPHIGYGCLAGKISIFIDPCGNAFPCVFLVSYIGADAYENVREHSIQEVWENGPTFHKLRNLVGNEKCLNCKSYSVCRGGCIARILYAKQPINGVDPWCLEKFFPAKL